MQLGRLPLGLGPAFGVGALSGALALGLEPELFTPARVGGASVALTGGLGVLAWLARGQPRPGSAPATEPPETWQALFEAAPAPMWVQTPEGQLLAVNRAAASAFGEEAPALVGRHVSELQATQYVEPVRKRYRPLGPELTMPTGTAFRGPGGTTWFGTEHTRAITWQGQPAVLTTLHDLTGAREAAARLIEAESLFHELLGCLEAAVWISDTNTGTLLYVSPAMRRITGREPEQILSSRAEWLNNVLEEDRPRVLADLANSRSGQRFGTRYRIEHPEKGIRTLEYTGVMVPDAQGRPQRLVGTTTDVTDRLATEHELRVAARILAQAREGILVTNERFLIIQVNEAFCKLTGFTAEEAIGQRPSVLVSSMHPPNFFLEIQRQLRELGHWQGEIWNVHKAGHTYLTQIAMTALVDEAGVVTHFVGAFSDLTEARRSEMRIHQLANFDHVTGLANRQRFDERVTEAAREPGGGVTVWAVGLDRFKLVNDALGRMAGDAVLAEVAERLRSVAAGYPGSTVARLQSDVFGLVVGGKIDVIGLGAEMLQQLALPFGPDSRGVHLTASAGYARCPADGTTAEELTRKSELAMFHAKGLGRSRIVAFTPELERAGAVRASMVARLRAALAEGALELHYQPQLSLRTGRLVGAEALVRWRDAEQGMVSPAVFIPLAEESGLIVELGSWVLREACQQASAWPGGAVGDLVVAVNISPLEFRQAGFAAGVAAALRGAGLAPSRLELEVTESVVMDGADRVRATLEELRQLGVRLSIDDFGTGYSSLAYLRRFPIDKLKIDQSFVREMLSDVDAAAITHAVVDLAKSLRLEVIAEGVETQEQAAFLTSIGCDEVQGWLYARAMPQPEFEAWCANRSQAARSRCT